MSMKIVVFYAIPFNFFSYNHIPNFNVLQYNYLQLMAHHLFHFLPNLHLFTEIRCLPDMIDHFMHIFISGFEKFTAEQTTFSRRLADIHSQTSALCRADIGPTLSTKIENFNICKRKVS